LSGCGERQSSQDVARETFWFPNRDAFVNRRLVLFGCAWKMRGLKEAADQNSRSAPLAPVLFGAVPGAAFACAPMHAAIGGEFATKPSCERPGLEHRQYGILRVLPYHFGIISATRSNEHLPRQIGSRLRRTGIDVSFHATSNADTSNPAY
jgi:hypothetical protein